LRCRAPYPTKYPRAVLCHDCLGGPLKTLIFSDILQHPGPSEGDIIEVMIHIASMPSTSSPHPIYHHISSHIPMSLHNLLEMMNYPEPILVLSH
jgi:hypothetical protein